MPEVPLAGLRVLVTGAAHGIGRSIATAMADAGADLAVTARSAARLEPVTTDIRSSGRTSVALELDQRDRSRIDATVLAASAALGGLDVVVCNAGVSGPSSDTREVTDDEWDDTLSVNLTGTFCLARAAARIMTDRGGVILLIGSMTGKRPLLNRAPYATTKLALVGLCRTMALDLGPSHIRVNVISPGFVEGERLDWVVQAQSQAGGRAPDAVREAMVEQSPLRRLTTAADVAAAAVFLASPSSGAITGVDLNVSAGLVMH